MWARVKEQLYQCFIVLDQGLNVFLFAGSADETISSRCFRLNHIKTYAVIEKIVNFCYRPFQGPDHCRNAYIKEVRGRQLPHDFFERAIEMGIFPANPNVLGDEVKVPE